MRAITPPAMIGECLPNHDVYDREAHIRSHEGGDLRSQHWPPDEWDLTFMDTGYSWCRACQEYHRLPEHAIGEDGLMDEGMPHE